MRDQGVGAVGAVDVQHSGRVRRRCSAVRSTGTGASRTGQTAALRRGPVLAPPSGSATMVGS